MSIIFDYKAIRERMGLTDRKQPQSEPKAVPAKARPYIIFFDSRSDLLSTGATMIISGIPLHGASKILVVGHTDTVGTARENQTLSERRAEAVAEYLHHGFGLPFWMIQDSGVNFSQPRVVTLPQVPCQENRRVEITIVP